MTTITTIDGLIPVSQRDGQRSNKHDFAHELVKEERRESSRLPTASSAAASSSRGQGSAASTAVAGASQAATELALGQQMRMSSLSNDARIQADLTVAPVGLTETLVGARIYGLHMQAGGYLSELALSDDLATKAADDGVPSSAMADKATDAPVSPVSVQAGASAAAVNISTPVQAAARDVQSAMESPSNDLSPATVVSEVSATSGSTAYWAERSLRFTQQPGGGKVAWLRDYRMSDREAVHLVDTLRSEASERGVALQRIMLNGREVWSSRSAN
jgi:hypothetical protein